MTGGGTLMRRAAWLVIGLVILSLAGGAWWAISLRRQRADLAEATRDQEAGRPALAHKRLAQLARTWPNDGEVAYRLGLAEQALGRPDAALAAWDRVPPGSPFAAKAAVLSATEYINTGRYAPAETKLEAVLPRAGPDRPEVLRALSRLYRFQGRHDDVRRVLRQSWPSPDPTGLLKELWLLDQSPIPAEALGLALDKADPNDDRVWLGRANLAIRTGRFDEADRWLDACEERRPTDQAVWLARLDLALATENEAEVWRALDHLPIEIGGMDRMFTMRAWLLARRGDATAERWHLEEWVTHVPSAIAAWERLAALAAQAGQAEEAARYQARKATLDEAHDRYRKLLLDEGDLRARAGELARLTNLLGRGFESQGWSMLQAGVVRPIAPEQKPEPPSGQALARRFADLRPAAPARAARPATERTGPPPTFVDDAATVGLRFVFDSGKTLRRQLPETMSGGVAVLDYNGDGWLDVFAVQGGPLVRDRDATPADGDRLFRNRGDGTFEDVTEASGLASLPRGYGLGATVGDVDNDGHPDLFVTRLRSYLLIRNRGDGTFEDATDRFGLAGVRDNPTSAAFADLDSDGDLDLYVCHYMVWDPNDPRLCLNEKGEYFYCDPSKVEAAPDHLFRNDGGRFVDVTAEAGIVDRDGRGLGVVAADLDDDQRLDLYVANDGTANFLFRNQGGLKFEETGHVSGVAGNAEGGYQASMGVAVGDHDGDGRPDLVVTNFYGEASTLYHNLGGGFFQDWTAPTGLGLATRYLLGFGIAFADVDNDGRLDLATTNGHVNDNRPFYLYAMPAQLLMGAAGGRFVDVSDRAGTCWKVPRLGRGLAVGDLDNDGRQDVLIVAQDEALAYFHNQTRAGHFVTFGLQGTTSNRDGVGARVTVTADGRRQVAQRFGGGSYQSASEGRLHFGLGDVARVDQVEILWPSGRTDRFTELDADAGYRVREGESRLGRLPGFGK